MKICYICKEEKSATSEFFHRNRNAPDGLTYECKTCNNRKSRKWKEDNPHKYRQSYRNTNLKRKFGIRIEDYDRLLEIQDGLCAVCKSEPHEDRSLAVDHDHETGEIRGLLCMKCNTALGKLGDNTALLREAIRYLEDPPNA